MNNFSHTFGITLFLLSISCNSQNQLQGSLAKKDQIGGLLTKLEANKNFIESVNDSLRMLIISRDDKTIPKKFLVTDGRAKLIKTQAQDLVKEFEKWKKQLEPLLIILNGCEGHEVDWDVYCFGDLPYYGVEPILRVYIRQYEIAIEEVKTTR